MDNHASPSLLPIVLVVTIASLVIAVLFLVGFPMAGTASALVGVAVSTSLTLSLAYIFAHGAKPTH